LAVEHLARVGASARRRPGVGCPRSTGTPRVRPDQPRERLCRQL